ncbi:hypothetical protein RE9425_03340 [Prescottella equi]|nr:hypothetical protein RE9425_03340 [Prescottella equi]
MSTRSPLCPVQDAICPHPKCCGVEVAQRRDGSMTCLNCGAVWRAHGVWRYADPCTGLARVA